MSSLAFVKIQFLPIRPESEFWRTLESAFEAHGYRLQPIVRVASLPLHKWTEIPSNELSTFPPNRCGFTADFLFSDDGNDKSDFITVRGYYPAGSLRSIELNASVQAHQTEYTECDIARAKRLQAVVIALHRGLFAELSWSSNDYVLEPWFTFSNKLWRPLADEQLRPIT